MRVLQNVPTRKRGPKQQLQQGTIRKKGGNFQPWLPDWESL